MTTLARRTFAVALAVTVYVLLRDLPSTPYDDSYFFKRFASNLLQHGVLAWNLADGPVYGITSQLFLLVATLLTWLAPNHFVLASKLFLAGSLCATALLLMRQAARVAHSTLGGAVVTLAALCSPPVFSTVHSGMETALALLVVTWSLGCIGEARARPVDAALRTLVVFLCRPDAALIPVVAFVIAHARDRAQWLRYGLVLGGGLGVCLGLSRAYYGTALPLPFYAKTLSLSSYGGVMARLVLHSKLAHLTTFAAFSAPLVVIAARRSRPTAYAPLAAAAVFIAYHALANNEIMGYRARFYLPALIPLALAAAAAWQEFHAQVSARAALAWALAWGACVVASYALGALDAERAAPPRAGWSQLGAPLSDRAFLARSSAEVTTVRGLSDVVRCLPDVAQVYHSEIGIVGLMLPDTRVVDLAGLMSSYLALEHPRFDDYCQVDQPEVIFLPHKNYALLNREILGGACLRSYVRVVKRSSSPLYVRQDLAPAFLACAVASARYR